MPCSSHSPAYRISAFPECLSAWPAGEQTALSNRPFAPVTAQFVRTASSSFTAPLIPQQDPSATLWLAWLQAQAGADVGPLTPLPPLPLIPISFIRQIAPSLPLNTTRAWQVTVQNMFIVCSVGLRWLHVSCFFGGRCGGG